MGKRGPEKSTDLTRLVTMRLGEHHLKILDDYAELRGLPNRAEAFRRSIEMLGEWLLRRTAVSQEPARLPEKPKLTSRGPTLAVDDRVREEQVKYSSLADEP